MIKKNICSGPSEMLFIPFYNHFRSKFLNRLLKSEHGGYFFSLSIPHEMLYPYPIHPTHLQSRHHSSTYLDSNETYISPAMYTQKKAFFRLFVAFFDSVGSSAIQRIATLCNILKSKRQVVHWDFKIRYIISSL